MPVALVTGAARGIGRATAFEFARRGFDLSLADQLAAELDQTAEEIGRLQRAAIRHAGDLADLAFAESLVRQTLVHFGRLDVLVNCAAWREPFSMREIGIDSWDRTLRVCLTTPAFLARWAAEAMRLQGGGVIVNISSMVAERPSGTAPAYTAAKGGLDSLTYELAATYACDGVRVVAVNPGAIDTAGSRDYQDAQGASLTDELMAWSQDAIPLGRWGRPEEVARVIALLASDEASYVTGVNLTVDGGWSHSLFPQGLLARMRRETSQG